MTRDQSTAGFTLASLFAAVLVAQIFALVIIHSYVIFEADGPSTFGTLRAVWVGGIALTAGLFAVERLS